jgi:hypothetical protein
VSTLSTKVRVTRLGKKILALGEFFSVKSPNDLGEILAEKKLVGRFFCGHWPIFCVFTLTFVESVDTFIQSLWFWRPGCCIRVMSSDEK